MTPAELLLASRGTTTGAAACMNPNSCASSAVVEAINAAHRSSAVRPCSIRLSWTIGLGGRLECLLAPQGLAMKALLTFEPASSRPLRSMDSMKSPASIGDCEVLHSSTDDGGQQSVTLRLANGQRATIEVVERGSDSEGSRYLVFTDLPAQLGFRGGTYVLNRVDVDA